MTAKRHIGTVSEEDQAGVTTPDDLPIEQWPGWDHVRGVFILDRSRTVAREAARRKAARAAREACAHPAGEQRVAR